MKIQSGRYVFAVLAVMMLGGCMATGGTEEIDEAKVNSQQQTCDNNRVDELVGLVNPSDQTVIDITGATSVRRVADGKPMTMELLHFRATIIIDPETGKVVRANCS